MNNLSRLLVRVDEEIERAKRIVPLMALGMLVIRKLIVESQKEEGDGE